MSLLREICYEAAKDYMETMRRPTERWLSPSEAAQALEEMKGGRLIMAPPSYMGHVYPPPPEVTTVDGSTVYTSAGPVVLRVLG